MKLLFLFGFSLLLAYYVDSYTFDEKSSCESMLPKLNSENDTKLSVGLNESPFKLTVSAPKYRRSRRLKVKLDGGEFNGFFLQAKQYSTRSSEEPLVIGNFVDFPTHFATLDCGKGSHVSVSNTLYYYNSSSTKKWMEVSWIGPPDDVGSIEFIATVIAGTNYWNPVKSTPLLFNEFPPSLMGCGSHQSCFRYSRIPVGESSTEYTMVSTVLQDDVMFTIGGKVTGDKGYVGVGFTNSSMSFVDMCVCVKNDSKTVVAAHFIREPNKAPQRIKEELEDAETDIDGNLIWCKFRRPLKTAAPRAADLSYGMTQVFLWGELDSDGATPIYPKEVVEVSEPWNHTLTVNVLHYIGGSNIVGISWTLISAALMATLIELYRM